MSNRSLNLADAATPPGLAGQVITASLCRLVLNTARRFVYPFAPVLSRGLGVPLTAVTSLIAVSQATVIPAMFFGPVADRWGYRLMMLAGLGMLVVGMFAGGFLPFYGVVLVAVFLAGMGKSVFDPAIQAYIGERVPFKRRGLVVGLVEFSWAGSTLVGIPLIAIIIDRLDWRAPFFALGGLGLVGIVAVKILIPADGKRTFRPKKPTGFWKTWGRLLLERQALGTIGFAFFPALPMTIFLLCMGHGLKNRSIWALLPLVSAQALLGPPNYQEKV